MDDLITWLREQLDDDERLAHAVLGADASSWDPYGYLPGEKRDYLALYSPARVLAEVDAKRRILDECGERRSIQAHRLLQLIALPYAGQPGYREDWRP